MTLSSPIAMAPPGAKGDQSVVVGQVKQGAANPTLLPAGFLQALGLDAGELPPRAPVQLSRSKLQAFRYTNLRPNGLSKAVTLFTVPTSAGVATLACVDPETNCEAIANTLKLNAGTAFPVGPSKDYAAALGKTLGGLDKKVASGRDALQGAKTPKAQAAAAGDLASAYGARGEDARGPQGLARRRRASTPSSAARSGRRARPTVGSPRRLGPATSAATRRRVRDGAARRAGGRRRVAERPVRGLQDREINRVPAPFTHLNPSRNRKLALHMHQAESHRARRARK